MDNPVIVLLSVFVVSVFVWFAYQMGRDSAEQKAFETVATLRDELRAVRLDNKRLREHMRRGGRDPEVEFDQWMR